ncbi:sugar kinase [Ilyomonas limi]|uniref:Sugar kinase n=1 Tax=Ilyomonas limi TaxID=2575867 RepID=A0A4U3KXD6_9BACT|nr:sugar kinase [Ilyomonas limi]TKK65826.1 sugar kinase [Ilyomonas limi]
MKKVLCFGELLLRMSPVLQQHWLHHSLMPVYTGGAELNVAQALAKWNMPVKYGTALPDNYLSHEIVKCLNDTGIDTSAIVYNGNRIGLYFLPQGADLKHASVIYDRAYSSFSMLQPGTIDWNTILENVDWLHFSAITPALGSNLVSVCKEALETASKKGITTSVDLNYRAKLWQWGKQPKEIMPELVAYCDVVMANIWSANTLLGIEVDEYIHDKKSKQAYTDHAYETARTIMSRFPNCKTVANTFRFDEGKGIHYYATLQQQEQQFISREFRSEHIVDKAGSGDCFMAGLMYGMRNNWQLQNIVDFAASAAVGKLHEKGDATQQNVEAIKQRTTQHEQAAAYH